MLYRSNFLVRAYSGSYGALHIQSYTHPYSGALLTWFSTKKAVSEPLEFTRGTRSAIIQTKKQVNKKPCPHSTYAPSVLVNAEQKPGVCLEISFT